MALQLGSFALGILALYFGAELLVRGASRLARSLGVSALVVGLTIVAFGTSTPEMVVSLMAAIRGQPDLAVGNVVGSNIANIALILGLAALVQPIRAEMPIIVREMPIMIGAAAVFALQAIDGEFSRLDGILLLIAFLGYVALMLRVAPLEPPATERKFEAFEEHEKLEPRGETRAWDGILVLSGLALLVAGANLLVGAAVWFARAWGISELAIGLTIVAVGTSLPELATSVVAAFRREAEIALGNIVGSNIFNILGILGMTAVVQPIGVPRSMFGLEIPLMIGLSIALPIVGWTRLRVERWEGALLVTIFVAFTVMLLQR